MIMEHDWPDRQVGAFRNLWNQRERGIRIINVSPNVAISKCTRNCMGY